MKKNITFFNAKPYDSASFDNHNKCFDFNIHYHEAPLNKCNAILAKGSEIVCAFVNATINAELIRTLAENGVKLIALRSGGFNNVDLAAARENKIKVVRVPAYSPHVATEHTLALMRSLHTVI